MMKRVGVAAAMAAMGMMSCGARRDDAKAPSAAAASASASAASTSTSTSTSTSAASATSAPAAASTSAACAPRRDAGAPPLWWEDANGLPAGGQQEVDASLQALAAALERHYRERGGYPEGQLMLTPQDSCCRQDFGARGLCAPSAAAFDDAVWCTLGFQPRGAHYFQYMYVGSKTTSTLVATGDLDCDGTSVSYVISAAVQGGAPRIQIVAPAPGTD